MEIPIILERGQNGSRMTNIAKFLKDWLYDISPKQSFWRLKLN